MRYQFIEEHRETYPVTQMCRTLDVSSSGYYAWRKRPTSAREMANRELTEKIKAVYHDSLDTYGSPRVYQELKAQGVVCVNGRSKWSTRSRVMWSTHVHVMCSTQLRATVFKKCNAPC
jgi:hypothetical protein